MTTQRRFNYPPVKPKPPAPEPERWTILLEAAPGGVPPVCRVRRLLKSAWRGYGLKARIVTGPEDKP